MGSAIAAFVLGTLFLLLGLYLTFGPLLANEEISATAESTYGYALPSWFYFPVGVPVAVSWSDMSPPDNVTLAPCSSVVNHTCESPQSVLAQGTGADGSFTFTAAAGQTYGVGVTSAGALSVEVQYASVYGFLLFLCYMMGVVGVALGFLYYSQGINRFRRF